MAKRVLIVDDSSFMRKRIKESLTRQGYDIVAEAYNGDEAIALYRYYHPDIVTMDITMRGKDGLSASREILEYDPQAHIVLLAMRPECDYQGVAETLRVRGFVLKSDLEHFDTLVASL